MKIVLKDGHQIKIYLDKQNWENSLSISQSNGRMWRTKEPLVEGEAVEWKTQLKTKYTHTHTHTHKTNIMVCGLITSWQTEGVKVEAVADFLFSGS